MRLSRSIFRSMTTSDGVCTYEMKRPKLHITGSILFAKRNRFPAGRAAQVFRTPLVVAGSRHEDIVLQTTKDTTSARNPVEGATVYDSSDASISCSENVSSFEFHLATFFNDLFWYKYLKELSRTFHCQNVHFRDSSEGLISQSGFCSLAFKIRGTEMVPNAKELVVAVSRSFSPCDDNGTIAAIFFMAEDSLLRLKRDSDLPNKIKRLSRLVSVASKTPGLPLNEDSDDEEGGNAPAEPKQ